MYRHPGAFCVVGLLLLSLTACAGDPVGRTLPVKGNVTVNGKPLNKGSVVYWPDADKGNKSDLTPMGIIGDDGSYELNTKGKQGAPAGAYKVTVQAQTDVDSTKPTSAKSLVPNHYATQAKTPLRKEVTDNAAAGAYDLLIK